MADLQVSLAFLLENQAEVAREIERAGGIAGEDFGKGLSKEAQKAFDDLIKQAEKAAKEAGIRFNKTKLQFETAKGDVIPEQVLTRISKTSTELDKARKAVDAFRSAVTQSSRDSVKSFNLLEAAVTGVSISLTNRLADSALVALGSVRGLTQGFLELDAEIRLAAAAAGEQGAYQKLGTVIEKVGIEAAGTSKQVAELATSLVRAGFTVDEVSKALPGVVRGAEATGTGFQQFGEIVGNTLRGFGLDVEETSRVVDVLTNAANSSNATIEGLGYTFQYAAPTAKALGVSMEDLASAAGLMANAGIQGSVAGTGLRTALEKLQQAAGGASPEVMGLAWNQTRLVAAMQKIGATVIDVNGKLLPLEQVFLRLKNGLDKLNQADRVQLSDILFGQEAGSKVLSLINQNTDAITKMFGDMRNSSGAADVARTAMSGARLEILQLQGTVDALGNKLGETIVVGLRPLVSIGNAAAGAIAAMPGPIKTTVSALVILTGAAVASTIALTALNLAVSNIGGWAKISSGAKAAAGSILAIGGSVLMFAGATAAVAVFSGAIRETDESTKSLLQTVVGLSVAIATLKTAAKFKAPPLISIGASVGAGVGAYQLIGSQIKATGESVRELQQETKALEDEIKSLQDQIQEGTELNMDVSSSEKRLKKLQSKLATLQDPLQIQIEIEAAKQKLDELRKKVNSLSSGDPGKQLAISLSASAAKYKEFLTGIEQGTLKGIFRESIKKDAEEIIRIDQQIKSLRAKGVGLDINAKDQRKQIDDQLAELSTKKEALKIRARIAIDLDSVKTAKILTESQLEDVTTKTEKRESLEKSLTVINDKLLKLQREQITNIDRINQKTEERVETLNTEEEYYKKLVSGTKILMNEQLAAGKITKSQAEENIRTVQLQQLEQQKLRKERELTERVSKGGNVDALKQEISDINEQRISLMDAQRQAELEKEVGLIQAQKAEYTALLSTQLSGGKISKDQYDNELRYLDRITLEKEKQMKVGQLKAVNSGTIEELSLRKEIADIDKSLAENRLATADAARSKLEKEVELHSTILNLASQNAEKSTSIAKEGYGMQLQFLEAIAENARARQDLIKSEFDVQVAYQNRLVTDAEAHLADLREKQSKATNEKERRSIGYAIERQEQNIVGLKEEGKRIAIEAKETEIRGLAELQRLERSSLILKQQMEIIDQKSRVSEAQHANVMQAIELKKLQVKAQDPKLSSAEQSAIKDQIALQTQALGLTAENVKMQMEKLDILGEIHKLESSTLQMNQQSRRNKLFSELINLGGARFAGGDVSPSKDYVVNELGRESFLSATGEITWINKPAYSLWRPPSRGMVLPADISKGLANAGFFSNNRSGFANGTNRTDMITQAIAPNNGAMSTLVNHTVAIAKLQKSIDRLANKDWNVTVPIPSNARLLRTVGAF